MHIRYEDVILEIDLSDSYQRTFVRSFARKLFGAYIGRPYQSDDYLAFGCEVLSHSGVQPTVVDIGCNIGATMLPIAKKYPRATVIGIDAHPVPMARCIANIALNGLSNVTVVQAAIGVSTDLIQIHTCPTNSGGHRVTGFVGRIDTGGSALSDNIYVASVRGDEIFEYFRIGRCDLLKVDVEGIEYQVLDSLGAHLKPDRIPNVVVEYGPEGMRAAGHSGWDLVEFMTRKGYRCEDLHSKAAIEKPQDIPVLPDFAVTDFLFRTSERLACDQP